MKKIIFDARTYFMVLLWGSIGFFIFKLIQFPLLPTKYLAPIVVVLILLAGLLTLAQYKTKKFIRLLGKLCIIIASALLIFINYTYFKATNLLDTFSLKQDIDIVSVIVKSDSDYEHIEGLFGKFYAAVENRDYFVDQTIQAISENNNELNMNLRFLSNYGDLVNELYNNTVDCIIINEAYRPIIEEVYATFSDDTKVIYSKDFTTQINVADKITLFDITQAPFSVYISGIDTRGAIATKSRSDANIIVTVNPKTKHILLTNIPRDAYVPFEVYNGEKEKLTHSGIFGINETKNNISNFMDLDIPYYVRVNFSTVVNVVDAIGGIDIYNPYSAFDFGVGNVHINGKEALLFSSERKSFSGGDNVRGQNQMIVLQAVINKICSPAIINNAFDLLDSLSGSFQTNMSDEEIMSLVRMQIDDMATWTIETQRVTGTGSMEYSHMYGAPLYAMLIDEDTIKACQEKIQSVYEE